MASSCERAGGGAPPAVSMWRPGLLQLLAATLCGPRAPLCRVDSARAAGEPVPGSGCSNGCIMSIN